MYGHLLCYNILHNLLVNFGLATSHWQPINRIYASDSHFSRIEAQNIETSKAPIGQINKTAEPLSTTFLFKNSTILLGASQNSDALINYYTELMLS